MPTSGATKKSKATKKPRSSLASLREQGVIGGSPSMAERASSRTKRRAAPPPLFAHQKDTVKFASRRKAVFDTSDPGTGKTRAHLEGFAKRRRKGKAGKCLVIAPKTLLQSAWGNDIEKFVPDMRYSIAYAENRLDAFSADCDIYITNTDAVKWLIKNPKAIQGFDTLIVDESTSFKHRTSQRSKAIAKLTKLFEYRRLLTGTPNSNTVTDVWHQAFLLDYGKRLGPNFFAFRNAVCEAKQIGPRQEHVKWTDKPGAEIAVAQLLGDITIRHEFEKCVDIPPNHTYTVDFVPPAKLMAQYHELEESMLLELEQDRVSAVNAAALRTKLLQVASGAVYTYGDEYTVLDDQRVELVMDLIEARKHSIVFFNWRHQRDQLQAAAKARGFEFATIDGSVTSERRRAAIVSSFQAGQYKTLFLHPRTGAHGLTLTRAIASIFVSPIYEPDLLKQGLHRIYRAGQTEITETILIQAKGTVEGKVYAMLMGKRKRMIEFLEMLKDNIHE